LPGLGADVLHLAVDRLVFRTNQSSDCDVLTSDLV
jgi:hypothetical protein